MANAGWGPTKAILIAHWTERLAAEPFEVLELALLDAAGRLLSGQIHRLGVGTVDRVAIYPRQVMRAAVKTDAAAVVICHNHPSGNNEPTQLDIDATRGVYLAGVTLDVKLVDHLIISEREVFSFGQEGLI